MAEIKDKYHHGALKKELIAKGLQLLNKEGFEGFSLRKVAVMCGVSHAAPYKHFQNKEELIAEITQEVVHNFNMSLETVVLQYPEDPEEQIVEMGKAYVKFMVENPEYLKFLFLSGKASLPVKIRDNRFIHEEDNPFNIFKQSALNYLRSIHPAQQDWFGEILMMWSVVHGLALPRLSFYPILPKTSDPSGFLQNVHP